MLRFFNLVSQGSAMSKTCIPVFLAMSLFNAANALSVTLTGEAELVYEFSSASINTQTYISPPYIVVSSSKGAFSYAVEIPAYSGWPIPHFYLSHSELGKFSWEYWCEEIYDIDLQDFGLDRPDCSSYSPQPIAGWDVTFMLDSNVDLTSPTESLVIAADGVVAGVSVKGAVGLAPNNPFILLTDTQTGPFGIEARFLGDIADPANISNHLEFYSTALGPRLYVEYENDTLGEFGAKFGAFQFAGTLSDGDAFNDLEFEWSTELAEGLGLEGQMRFDGTFQASLMTQLSF